MKIHKAGKRGKRLEENVFDEKHIGCKSSGKNKLGGNREIRQVLWILRLSHIGQQKLETRGSEVVWKMDVPHAQVNSTPLSLLNLFSGAQCFRSAVNEH